MFIKSGEKVLIIEDVSVPCPFGQCHGDDDINIVGTKGSLGVVTSSVEFKEFLFLVNEERIRSDPLEKVNNQRHASHLRPNRKGFFPVRLAKIAPPDDWIKYLVHDQDRYLIVGNIFILPRKSFQVISEDEYANLLLK